MMSDLSVGMQIKKMSVFVRQRYMKCKGREYASARFPARFNHLNPAHLHGLGTSRYQVILEGIMDQFGRVSHLHFCQNPRTVGTDSFDA